MTIEERAKALVAEMKPLFNQLPRMMFEIQRESKRERKRLMDERSRMMNKKTYECGEVDGIKYEIETDLVKDLKEKHNINAINEIKTAIIQSANSKKEK